MRIIVTKKMRVDYLPEGLVRVTYDDNRIEYSRNGFPHREDGPAVIKPGGFEEWYFNGKRHRMDGPALIWEDGTRKWAIHGKLHREDGPAVEYPNGEKKWYRYGELHREDGPAAIFANGEAWYYLWDQEMSQLDHFRKSPHFNKMTDDERMFHRLQIS